jgi:hypothetical protein
MPLLDARRASACVQQRAKDAAVGGGRAASALFERMVSGACDEDLRIVALAALRRVACGNGNAAAVGGAQTGADARRTLNIRARTSLAAVAAAPLFSRISPQPAVCCRIVAGRTPPRTAGLPINACWHLV